MGLGKTKDLNSQHLRTDKLENNSGMSKFYKLTEAHDVWKVVLGYVLP